MNSIHTTARERNSEFRACKKKKANIIISRDIHIPTHNIQCFLSFCTSIVDLIKKSPLAPANDVHAFILLVPLEFLLTDLVD